MRKDSLRIVLLGSPLLLCLALLFSFLSIGMFCLGGSTLPVAILLGLAAAGLLAYFPIGAFKALSGKHQKSLLRLYAAAPDPEAFPEKIAALYLSPPVQTIWLDKQYLIYQSLPSTS